MQLIRQQCGFCLLILVATVALLYPFRAVSLEAIFLFLGFPTYPLLAGSSLVVCCFFTAFIMSINTPITAAATTSDNFYDAAGKCVVGRLY